ncbi:hypothetical protein N7462_004491 [Penicillium macrosclerotiorum]|uniref:uncharacterized protein n=1 Tax=Penicillium macrosclerotiorum TaxID=303699 RepID=UPI002546A2F3|nr:uncharacterized protein N7462_004491 [Penicillium macrosclerotiorum]KAJ5690099.1 hypothetical protein N7462_004491 [Penicillium macrosclerotiorum]
MSVIEISCMGVRPSLDIMDESTREGQILRKVWDTVTTDPGGPHRVYWGLENDESSKLWTFFDWDSIEDHEHYAKMLGPAAVKDLPTILNRGFFTKHITVAPSPPSALRSPMTDIIRAYFACDIAITDKDLAAAQIRLFLEDKLRHCPTAEGLSCGWSVENDLPVLGGPEGQTGSMLIAFIGWRSVAANKQFWADEGLQELESLFQGMEGMIQWVKFHIHCRSLARDL